MPKKELAVITIESHSEFTLDEICQMYHISPEWIEDLISYGILELKHQNQIDAENARRIRRLKRLQSDFELNTAGAVLASELLEHIEMLQKKVELYEKYFRLSKMG